MNICFGLFTCHTHFQCLYTKSFKLIVQKYSELSKLPATMGLMMSSPVSAVKMQENRFETLVKSSL